MGLLIKDIASSIKLNFRTLVLFELIHHLVSLTILIPIFFKILSQLMVQADLSYLSPSQVYQFILSPETILLGVLMIFSLGFHFFFEIHSLITLFHASFLQQKISLIALYSHSFKHALRIFFPQNLILLFGLIFLIPSTASLFRYFWLDGTNPTEFLFDFIYQRTPLHPLYFTLIIILQLISLWSLFVLPIICIKNISLLQACRESFQLIKQQKKAFFIYFLNHSLFLIIFFTLLYGFLIWGCGLMTRLLMSAPYEKLLFYNIALGIKNMLAILAPHLFLIGFCAFSTTLFLKSQRFLNHKVAFKNNHFLHPFLANGLIILLSFYFGELISPDNLYSDTSHLSDEIKIVAHRGGSYFAPENTLAALNYAILSGADMAEIDVQQTKDGEIVLMHDSNLQRTTGFNQRVLDTTISEIKELDAGSSFSANFIGETVPTLEEALQLCKGELMLMIEIKVSEGLASTTKKVIDLIEAYDMESECIVGSMDYRILQIVKMLNPKIPTVYITALAYGDYQNLEDVDFYSIESSFISVALIDQIHRSGKQIYAWTVNKEATMQSLISMQVDGIVTDDPALLKQELTHISDPYIAFIANLFFPS